MTINSEMTQVLSKQPVVYKKIVIAFILIALVSMVYTVYSSIHFRQTIRVLMADAQALKQQQLQTTRNLDAMSSDLQKSQRSVAHLKQDLSRALQKNGDNTWRLFKARFYLELAMINTHWSQNTETSIALLQEADAVLSMLHDPRVIAIRQALAKEISDTQAIQTIDLTGILTRFDAIQQTLNQLTPKHAIPLTRPTHPDTNTALFNPSATWREHLKESVQFLRQLVVIRHHDDSMDALLVPGYESLLRETIRLNLQEAQWAVIQQNQAIYQIVLTQAIRTLSVAFDGDKPATKVIIQQLQSLQDIPFDTKKPTMSRSLDQINQWIDELTVSRVHEKVLFSGEQS
jgi:uroporphyrin-III C-methyltransferase